MTGQAALKKQFPGMELTGGGEEHWIRSGDSDLYAWEKRARKSPLKGTILFVHGSSMASRPTFDLQVADRPYSSAMDYFADQGFDTWCFDCRGYGYSDKRPGTKASIAEGAADAEAVAEYIGKLRNPGSLLVYGISSGALRAAGLAENRPDLVGRLALDAFVWTGEGSHTLENRRKKLPDFKEGGRRPVDRAFVHSIFERDHPGTAEEKVIEAFADGILAYDDSLPNGTYIDMCAHLPVTDPAKIKAATLILRGEYDGIAGFDDLLKFFAALPNPDKQFSVMAGISHASFQQKNYMLVYHILIGFFTQPPLVYRGG